MKSIVVLAAIGTVAMGSIVALSLLDGANSCSDAQSEFVQLKLKGVTGADLEKAKTNSDLSCKAAVAKASVIKDALLPKH